MLKTAYGTEVYIKDQKIKLSGVISIWAYNDGEAIAIVDSYPIYPKQKAIIVMPDVSCSDIDISLVFKPVPVDPKLNLKIAVGNELAIEGILPYKIEPKVRQTIILYVKKIIQ